MSTRTVLIMAGGTGGHVFPALAAARVLRERGWGTRVSYSRKVFVPLSQLCLDVCHYCTFAKTPRKLDKVYLEPDDVL